MDTLTLKPERFSKVIVNTFNVSIIVGLLFSQHIFEGPPILASEQLTIANNAIVSPLLNTVTLEKNIREKLSIEEQSQKFEEEIRKKYKTGVS